MNISTRGKAVLVISIITLVTLGFAIRTTFRMWKAATSVPSQKSVTVNTYIPKGTKIVEPIEDLIRGPFLLKERKFALFGWGEAAWFQEHTYQEWKDATEQESQTALIVKGNPNELGGVDLTFFTFLNCGTKQARQAEFPHIVTAKKTLVACPKGPGNNNFGFYKYKSLQFSDSELSITCAYHRFTGWLVFFSLCTIGTSQLTWFFVEPLTSLFYEVNSWLEDRQQANEQAEEERTEIH